ncbi:MAG: hypothetical protein J6A01_00030 [Proteobacteria bacterium]|nr:hypothetical protein [Pseudomonadota bacterium]
MKFCFRLLIGLAAIAMGSMPIVAMAEMPCSGYEDPDGSNEVNLTVDRLKETSGLVVSRSNPNYLWAHNDSDGNSSLFLINRQGTILKTFYTQLTANIDWEDIAIGPCEPWSEKNCIYVADTGDNLFTRTDKRVFMMEEPDVKKVSDIKNGQILKVIRTWNIKYPDTGLDASSDDPEILKFVNPDAESIMVRPGSAEVYIISKQSSGGEQTLFEMTRGGENAGQLNKIASYEFVTGMGKLLPLVNATTAADFHPNGYRFAIRTYATIFEYDLIEHPDIADAFLHPVERFDSFPMVELQGESLAYDLSDGVSLITGAEGRDGGNGKMHFYKCIPNPDYVEPEPIQAPDPLPEYDPEPEPVLGCPDDKYHVYLERCEYDTIKRCNDHDYVCADNVENWVDGYCKYNRCIVSQCAEGTHLYTNGLDLWSDSNYESQCEANTLENCGSHGNVCAESVEHWAEGTCTTDGHCIVSACVDGYHILDGNCAEDDVDNCGEAGNSCASQILHWADGQCIDKTCFVTACNDNYHAYEAENTCEEDSVEHCGTHENDCSQSVDGWAAGACEEHACVVNACVEPRQVVDNVCVEPSEEPGPEEPGPEEPGPEEPGPEEPSPEEPGPVAPTPGNTTPVDDEQPKYIYATDHDCSAVPMQSSTPISGALLALLGLMGMVIRRRKS